MLESLALDRREGGGISALELKYQWYRSHAFVSEKRRTFMFLTAEKATTRLEGGN